MVDTDTNRPPRDQHETTSLTLADLSMLVVGFALAFSLPRLYHLADRITIGNSPMPGGVVYLFVIREAAMKGGLVLAPVILARRARFGGLPRPADWMAILIVLPLLDEVIQRSDWMKRFARWYLVDFQPSLGYPVPSLLHESHPGAGIFFGDVGYFGYEGFPIGFTPGDEARLWGWFATILLVMISTALGLGWKSIPGWAKTGLLWLAALTWLVGMTSLLSSGLFRASRALARWSGVPTGVALQIALGLGRLPEGLLFGVPIVVTISNVRRGSSRTWAWTCWFSTTIALLALSIGAGIYWCVDLSNRSDPIIQTRLVVQALRLIAVGLMSWLIVMQPQRGRNRTRRLVNAHVLSEL